MPQISVAKIPMSTRVVVMCTYYPAMFVMCTELNIGEDGSSVEVRGDTYQCAQC